VDTPTGMCEERETRGGSEMRALSHYDFMNKLHRPCPTHKRTTLSFLESHFSKHSYFFYHTCYNAYHYLLKFYYSPFCTEKDVADFLKNLMYVDIDILTLDTFVTFSGQSRHRIECGLNISRKIKFFYQHHFLDREPGSNTLHKHVICVSAFYGIVWP
jgi:hypothetical protein